MANPAAEVTVSQDGKSVSVPTQLYINGEWVDGSGKPLDVLNPATEEHLATVHTGTAEDVDRAVKAAREAFNTTWGLHVAGAERGRLLFKLADIIESNREDLVTVESADSGKPYAWSNGDIQAAIDAIRYYGGMAAKIHGYTVDVGEAQKQVVVRKEPVGVAGVIVPWNFPLMLTSWGIAPALAAGCCVILKPAENTPVGALKLAQFIEQAGFPKGVFNLVNGLGGITGQAIVDHMDIDKVSFTGSTAVGKHIAACAAKSNLKTVTLELGGKSPNIIFPSAKLEDAAKWAALGIFETTGQSCIVGSRILVHEDVHDKFLEHFLAAVKQIKVGKESKSFYGSLISKVQFDKVLGYIEDGKKEAKLEAGGSRHGDKGFFVQPTVFSGVTNDHKIAREEIFGPVASIIKFKTEEEALQVANDTTYGLAAAVHSTDHGQIMRTTAAIRAGTVWVCQYANLNCAVPFGGMKQSGWGRQLGPSGIEGYLTTKAVHHWYGGAPTWPMEL